MKEESKRKREAIAHFKSTGEWFEGGVMHHKDMRMKEENPEQYYQWNPDDLVFITREEHMSIHRAFNVASGGMTGKHHTEETKQKLRDANLGKKYSDETKQKLSEMRKGHPVSEETRKKISEATKGRKGGMLGKHQSEEHRQKISLARKAYWARRKELDETKISN